MQQGVLSEMHLRYADPWDSAQGRARQGDRVGHGRKAQRGGTVA